MDLVDEEAASPSLFAELQKTKTKSKRKKRRRQKHQHRILTRYQIRDIQMLRAQLDAQVKRFQLHLIHSGYYFF